MLATMMIVHILSILVWVGGMLFAHFILRPVANSLLEVPIRLPFMAHIFTYFFPLVWGAIIGLWASGLWMIFVFYQGMMTLSVHLMSGLALVMTGLFTYIFFVPFPNLKHAIHTQDLKEGGRYLATIRKIVATNLFLGLTVTIIALLGRYL